MKIKVVCVTHDYTGPWSSFSAKKWLKIDEWYEVEDHGGSYYTFYYDKNSPPANLAKGYFKTIDQIREEKLNALCL